jgi:protein phosphatase
MRFHIAAVTDVGRVRQGNEDTFLIGGNEERIGLGNHDQGELAGDSDFIAVVADGMGGRGAGDWAARAAVEAINGVWIGRSPETPIAKVLEDALRTAHEIIERESRENPDRAGAGATVGLVAHTQNQCVVATVGDVAVILKRGDEFFKPFSTNINLTGLVCPGILDVPLSRKNFRYIMDALGLPEVDLLVSIGSFEPFPGDVILILSDGVHERLGEDRVHELTQSNHLADLPSRLVAEGNAAGGEDNLTAVLCRFAESGAPAEGLPSLEWDFQVIRSKPSPQ